MAESPGLELNSIADPVWNGLQSTHRPLGLHAGLACKYRADVAPFAAVAENTEAAMEDLRSLMAAGEYTYLIGEPPPAVEGLTCTGPMGVLQMLWPESLTLPQEAPGPEIVRMSCDEGPAMLALTDAAFPGFFRARTCEMGRYYGVWEGGRLIAMGGERLILNPFREISGICTLPGHRGRGLAARIIGQLLRDHRGAGFTSWLHVTSTNRKAIELYLRMGFVTLREVQLYRVTALE